MSQPYPSSGQPAGPLRPAAPAPVLTAVKLMYAVLFGLATLELIRVRPQYPGGYLAHFAVGGHVYPVIHSVIGATVLGLIVPVLLWLAGLAAVWLLWRPASSAFFNGRVNPARTALS